MPKKVDREQFDTLVGRQGRHPLLNPVASLDVGEVLFVSLDEHNDRHGSSGGACQLHVSVRQYCNYWRMPNKYSYRHDRDGNLYILRTV